jgi:hypothetical protein
MAAVTLNELGSSPPSPLTRRERSIVFAASDVAAISRFFALARTAWDWDELLFMEALQRFDVSNHRPHPPGFPLYVLVAKAMQVEVPAPPNRFAGHASAGFCENGAAGECRLNALS